MEVKKCENCKKKFYRNSLSQYFWKKKKFCSKKCQSNNKSHKCKCRNCKKIFYIRKRSVNMGRGQFCSRICSAIYGGKVNTQQNTTKIKCDNCKKFFLRGKARLKQSKSKNHKNYCSKSCEKELRTAINTFCSFCKKPLHRMLSRIENFKNHYCSKKCTYESLKKPKLKRICVTCKKDFYIHKSSLSKGSGKYCSVKCYYPDAEKINIKCYNCNKTFEKYKKRLTAYNFCSKYCFTQKQETGWGVISKGLDGNTYSSKIEALFSNFLHSHELIYERGVKISKIRNWTCDFLIKDKDKEKKIWIEIDGMDKSRKIPYYDQKNNPKHDKIKYLAENKYKFIVIRNFDFTKKCKSLCKIYSLKYDKSFMKTYLIKDLK